MQIHLHKAFFSDDQFLDSLHKSFLNQTTLDLRKEKWTFLNREFTVLTIHKSRILRKKPLEKTFLDFKKWVKSIQTAGYNGARTVHTIGNKVTQKIKNRLPLEFQNSK